MAGYQAGNVTRNVVIPGGIRLFFKRDGDTNHTPLGDLSDISGEPIANFLNYDSAYNGIASLAKELLQNRSIQFTANLNETAPNNLRFAWLAGAIQTGSINIPSTATPQRTAAGTFVLPEASASIVQMLAVTSEDGTTTYAETTDYTISGNTLTVVTSSTLDTDTTTGDKIHVLYEVLMSSSDTQKMEVLSDTSIEGTAQFHVRNQDGGLAQVVVLDKATIRPNGAIPFSFDGPQALPIIITGQVLDGSFGQLYIKSIA